MLNNKGFAISIILYSITTVILTVLMLILAVNAVNIHNNSNLADEVKKQLYEKDINNKKDNSDTNKLSDLILVNNTIIDTTPNLGNIFGFCTGASSDTGSGSCQAADKAGLYKSTDTNSGNTTYYYRGNVTNNYVSFANFTWRIVRINEDGTIRLIMQDGINNNATYQFNSNYQAMSNTYSYYSNSNAKTTLESWYNNNLSSYSSKIATGNYYCEQTKAVSDSGSTGGGTLYSSYTPDFKCSTSGYGLISASIGLITYDEIVYAGGYSNIINANYYLYNGQNGWTMSPAGTYYASGTMNAYAWYILSSGNVDGIAVNNSYTLRPVINLKEDTNVTGEGTTSNPYVVK